MPYIVGFKISGSEYTYCPKGQVIDRNSLWTPSIDNARRWPKPACIKKAFEVADVHFGAEYYTIIKVEE